MKKKIQELVSPLYDKVWHGPKGRLSAKLRTACDNMPQKRRITLVAVLFTVFVLTAFFLFGNACYHIGAGNARKAIQVEHIQTIDLPVNSVTDEAAR